MIYTKVFQRFKAFETHLAETGQTGSLPVADNFIAEGVKTGITDTISRFKPLPAMLFNCYLI